MGEAYGRFVSTFRNPNDKPKGVKKVPVHRFQKPLKERDDCARTGKGAFDRFELKRQASLERIRKIAAKWRKMGPGFSSGGNTNRCADERASTAPNKVTPLL